MQWPIMMYRLYYCKMSWNGFIHNTTEITPLFYKKICQPLTGCWHLKHQTTISIPNLMRVVWLRWCGWLLTPSTCSVGWRAGLDFKWTDEEKDFFILQTWPSSSTHTHVCVQVCVFNVSGGVRTGSSSGEEEERRDEEVLGKEGQE